MNRAGTWLFLAFACAACAIVEPEPVFPAIAIANEDDEPATVSVLLAGPGGEAVVVKTIEVPPGATGAIDMEPAWASDDFVLHVNNIVTVDGGWFGGCEAEVGFTDPLLEVIVRPNGGPEVCP